MLGFNGIEKSIKSYKYHKGFYGHMNLSFKSKDIGWEDAT